MTSKRKTSKDKVLIESKQSLDKFLEQAKLSPFKNQLSVDHMILIAGFLNATNFIGFVNERIGKKSHHFVDRGEALACITVLVYSGNYRSLNASESAVIGAAIAPLLKLNKSVLPEHLNRDVYADALEATYVYGTAKLYDEFTEHVLSLDLTKIDLGTAVHIDTTSMLKMGLATNNQERKEAEIRELNKAAFNELLVMDEVSYDESLDAVIEFNHWSFTNTFEPVEDDGVRPVDFKHGHSKDHRPDKPQVLIGSAVDSQNGLPLVFRMWDGNRSDKLNFEDVVAHVGDAVSSAFANIKTIVGDSALCTRRSFDAAAERGLSVLTRAPDNMSITKQAFASDEPLVPICSEEEWRKTHGKKSAVPKARLIEGEELLGHKVVGCLIHNENLRSTKVKSVNTAAEKELKAACKLSKKVFKCMPDAKAAYQEASKKLKYCTFEEFQCEADMGYATSGRPKEGAEMVVKGYRIVSAVHMDEQKVETAITHECMYLLVSTDVDKAWTPLDFQLLYKGNIQVENIWKELKNKRLHLSRFFLQKTERIEGLLWVVFVALFARRFLKAALATAIADKKIELPKHFPGFNKTTPQVENIDYFFKGLNVSYTHNNEPILSPMSPTVISVLAALGEWWYDLMMISNFEGYHVWPKR